MINQLIHKCIFAFLLFIAFTTTIAQIDSVWTRNLGGSSTEANGLTLMNNLGSPGFNMDVNDNGIYIVSSTLSNDGLVPLNAGSEDIWVVKLNLQGDTLWSKIFGGNDIDRPHSIIAHIDGGCIIAGRTLSNNGDFVGNHGGSDGFVIRLDAQGNVVWKKIVGGSSQDYLYDVIISTDGSVVACGETDSNDGDLAGTGSGLSWVIKFNETNGNILWSKTYTGPNGSLPDALENFYRIIELSDGTGYIAGGYTVANFNDINGDDIYIHKISYSGNSIWHQKYGSTNGPEGIGSLLDGGNGNFYVIGRLGGSMGPDVTSGYYGGNGDIWLLKIGSSGNKIWDKHYGGTNWDIGFDIAKDTLNYLYLAGFTRSTDNDASSASYGLQDFWVIKTDSSGNIIWNKKMGGSQNDVLQAINILHHQIYVMGRTNSTDQWIHHSWGDRDIWVGKFTQNNDSCSTTNLINVNACNNYLSPSGNYVWTNSGTYLDTIPNAAGCDSIITVQLTIYNISDLTTTVSGNTINANNTNASYQWLDCGNNFAIIPGANGQSFTPTISGSYAVEITENGCVDTSGCENVFITGLEEPNSESAWSIYPNPSKGDFAIEAQAGMQFELMDYTGKIIRSYQVWKDRIYIQEKLSSGLYLIRNVESGIIQKLVIQN